MTTGTQQPSSACSRVVEICGRLAAEDPVSEEERALVDAHRRRCPQCDRFAAAVLGLSAVGATWDVPHQWDDAVDRVVRRYGRRRAVLWGSAAVAAVLVMAAAVWAWRWTQSGGAGGGACDPIAVERPLAGIAVARCGGRGAWEFGKRTVRLRLRSGAVVVSVQPQRSDRRAVEVAAPDGVVRVVGTVFGVRVDDAGTRVEVYRGAVQVRTRTGAAVRVGQGRGWRIGAAHPWALTPASRNPILDGLRAHLPIDSAAAPAPPSRHPVAADAAAARENASHGDTAAAKGALPVGGTSVSGGNVRPSAAGHRRVTPPRAGDLLAAAQEHLAAHRWQEAADAYRQVITRYPRHPAAWTARIGLARISLYRLHRPRDALRHYRDYVQHAPHGPLAEEAWMGLADTWRHLGDREQERRALETLVATFPHSALAAAASRRLRALDGTPQK